MKHVPFISLLVIVLVVTATACMTAASGVPYIPAQFSVTNVQVDDTTGAFDVVRHIIDDPINRRSKMTATGSFVDGFLEQVVRCDGPLSPMGYFLQLSGPDVNNTMCVNQTTEVQWSNFWSFPANATYLGKEYPPLYSQQFDCYMYWDDEEQYKVYLDTRMSSSGATYNVPIWSGKVFTAKAGYRLYHMQWVNFQAGTPPISEFTPTGNTDNCQQGEARKYHLHQQQQRRISIRQLLR